MRPPSREPFRTFDSQAEWRQLPWAQDEAVKPLGRHHVEEQEAIKATEGPRSGPQSAVGTSSLDPSLTQASVMVACALDGTAPPGTGTYATAQEETEAIPSVPDTIDRMWAHVEDAVTQAQCCQTLEAILKEDPSKIGELVEKKGFAKICMALSAHAGVEEVVVSACALLWRLGLHLQVTHREELGRLEALEEVKIVMMIHLHSARVQCMACRAILSLVSNHADNKARAAAALAVKNVGSCMEVHAEDMNVQKHACDTLASLCSLATPPEDAGYADASKAVLAAMRRFIDDDILQAKACAALASLAMGGKDAQDSLSFNQALLQTYATMKAHEANPSVQQQVLAAMRMLTCTPAHLASLTPRDVTPSNVAAGEASMSLAELVGQICNTLKRHLVVAGVQVEGFGALRNFCLAPDLASVCLCIGGAGGIERICEGMLSHPGDPDVQEQGCSALWSLACHMENRGLAAELHGIELVCQAMELHSFHPGVQAQACGALHNLSCKATNPERIEQAKGADLLLSALYKHTEKPIVQEEGKRALDRLMLSSSNGQPAWNVVTTCG